MIAVLVAGEVILYRAILSFRHVSAILTDQVSECRNKWEFAVFDVSCETILYIFHTHRDLADVILAFK